MARSRNGALILLACSAITSAQVSVAVVGDSYAPPQSLRLAPGQVVTLFVSGIGEGLREGVVATTSPWPTTLAGITVTFRQGVAPIGPIAIPLFSIHPFNACGSSQILPCATLLAITVQIPFEMGVGPYPPAGALPNGAAIQVSDGRSISGGMQVTPVPDKVHILRWGDIVVARGFANGDQTGSVTHADGRPVTADNPAKGGETLVMYAVGLGATTPAVQTGRSSPDPAAKPIARFALDFVYRLDLDYTPNELLRKLLTPERTENDPISVSLVPGFTGLYQVNFVVPEPPANLGVCGGRLSNLVVTLLGTRTFVGDSYDQIGICVAPPAM